MLANDTVANTNVPITGAQLVTPPAQGTLTFNSDGTFTYAPPTYFVGTATFTYAAVNAVGDSSPATVTITVTNANLPPIAYAGTLTVQENTPASGFLSALNPDGPVVFSIAQQGTLGVALITNAGTGAYTYTPNTGAVGADTFTFSVANAANPALSSTATISVTIKAPPVVSITANLPSPQVVGTAISYTATVTGLNGALQYEFVAQYKLANGTWAPNIVIQSWNTGNQCTWTPAAANIYDVEVYVCPAGGPVSYATYGYLPYTMLPSNLTGVTLNANPSAPQVIGTQITLTAAAQGGIAAGTVQYQFVAQYRNPDGSWAPNLLLQDWSTNNQCTWVPTSAELYYLNVYARPVGSTASYVATTYIGYLIQPANLTGVTLSANPSAPQMTGTPITLTAAAQGGIAAGNVEYQFYAQYKLADGSWSPEILIRDWNTNPQCSWTPALAENYYVTVAARAMGSTAPVVTTYITYNILPANLTALTLSASPSSPQKAGTQITLTANPIGGISAPNVEYKFVAQYKLANGSWAPNILLQDWSTSNQCTWTPATAEKYYLNVYARPVGDTAPYVVTSYISYTIQ